MPKSTPEQPAKPGKACLGCYRRKLKCSQDEDGCSSCTKADLPCVYPVSDQGVKRKRGPYKKDKAPRERHIEHLVKYLEPQQSGAQMRRQGGQASAEMDDDQPLAKGLHQADIPPDANHEFSKAENLTEHLVEDALAALTQTCSAHHLGHSGEDKQALPFLVGSQPRLRTDPRKLSELSQPQLHQYWQLFVSRVDPVIKLVHCPSLGMRLFTNARSLSVIDPGLRTLCYGICYIAVVSCTAREAHLLFGEGRESLLGRYSHSIEVALADDGDAPSIESLQALVLYMIGIRRKDEGTPISTLFGLARRLAQMLNLNQDPPAACAALESELRRRLWWHLCSLESRGAEELAVRKKSIKEDSNVALPTSYNDIDLSNGMQHRPEPCRGRTDMTPILLLWENQLMMWRIWKVKKSGEGEGIGHDILVEEQKRVFEKTQLHLASTYLQYLHASRPMDWWCLTFHNLFSVKASMMIDNPLSQFPTKKTSNQERLRLLQSSVSVIRLTHATSVDPRAQAWQWYSRSFVQWHSLAVVIAELGHIKNQRLARNAWAVLDPILVNWNKIYARKNEEPAWIHVNTLIARARRMRDVGADSVPDPVNATSVVSRRLEATESSALSPPRTTYPPQDAQALPDPSVHMPSSQGYDLHPGISACSSTAQYAPSLSQTVPMADPTDNASPFSYDASLDITAFDLDHSLDAFDVLGKIDLSAFDAVFGGEMWDLPDLNGDADSLGII
ncbi:hypothetical protein LTR62_005168 [Meristemomyces frigidus]|uniref:Zn(2)-C6 fungal-type domain-containing protein n=1 Tax=Meristemomyces frigidus TaxID=1508187 RepID=A0AAN7TFN6_9PEZI|nr:hypothetical protein LTR62_005168 [Meristemomyces frigidus]